MLLENMETEKAAAVNQKSFLEPVFDGVSVHPDTEPSLSEMNLALDDITTDLVALEMELSHAAESYDSLMENAVQRLTVVEEKIAAEEERIRDLNTICGNFNEFETVIQLYPNYWAGTAQVTDSVFHAINSTEETQTGINVINITGNGFIGNGFVYDGENFQSAYIDRSSISNLTDNNHASRFEYARLSSTDRSMEDFPKEVNFDDSEAECMIEVRCATSICGLRIDSDMSNIEVIGLTYSSDGSEYTEMLSEPLEINNADMAYRDGSYIYNSGIIAFPYSHYARIRLRSGGTTDDTLAFVSLDTTDAASPEAKIVELPNVKRHVVRLTSIVGITGSYEDAVMETGEILASSASSFAIFANEYVPQYFGNDTYFRYYANVDGETIEMVPINSNRSGIKLLRYSGAIPSSPYIKRMKSEMSSIHLKVEIKAHSGGGTPYLSNIKACIGRAEVAAK